MTVKTREPSVLVVTQKIPSARLKRLRFSWFLLGGVCGVGLGALVPALISGAVHEGQPSVVKAQNSSDSRPAGTPAPVVLSTAQAPIAVMSTPTMVLPADVSLRVDRGDTLLTLLTDTGIAYEEAHFAVEAIREFYNPRRLGIGAQVAVSLAPLETDPNKPVLKTLSFPISRTAMIELERISEGNYTAKKIEAPVTKKQVRLKGTINSSFYKTGMDAGVPVSALAQLMKAYSYDVDFQRDIHPGNELEVFMERTETEDGLVTDAGDVLFASLKLSNRTVTLYRYEDKKGKVDYFNEKGESLRKALLKTPINGARITSGFGMRKHPILGYSKMHKGMDFGAAPGTPIYAAGDGTVDYAGRKGAYGNYVRIKHTGKYSTAYAHASRIASGIKPGKKVNQGDVIAYVGTTGRSTGPHLHYEILANGKQVNPSGVTFKTGTTLAGGELTRFKGQIAEIQTAMKNAEPKVVASR